MQFIDLKAQYHRIKEEVQQNINQVLEHGQFILGPEVGQLEEKLKQFTHSKHALAVSSGTTALQVALMALGIGPGDEVITSPFTFIASVTSILLVGATPRLADVDAKTYNIDPEKIEKAISPNTKAVIAVDLFGQCADYKAIRAIAKKHNIKLIADAAQSFGASQHGVPTGRFGDITTTSFYPAKPLGAYGEGGACFTDNDELAAKMRHIHNHGQDVTYNHLCLGINARLETMQAAILLAKLTIFADELSQRQKIADFYNKHLNGEVTRPFIKPENNSSYAMYTILVQNRPQIQQSLKAKGIPTAVHYPKPVHLQPACEKLGYKQGDFPIAEQLSQQVLSLPMHPYLSESQLRMITDTVNELVSVKTFS